MLCQELLGIDILFVSLTADFKSQKWCTVTFHKGMHSELSGVFLMCHCAD